MLDFNLVLHFFFKLNNKIQKQKQKTNLRIIRNSFYQFIIGQNPKIKHSPD